MKVKELFKALDGFTNSVVSIYDSQTSTWTTLRLNGEDKELFAQFQNRVVHPYSVSFGTDDYTKADHLNITCEVI